MAATKPVCVTRQEGSYKLMLNGNYKEVIKLLILGKVSSYIATNSQRLTMSAFHGMIVWPGSLHACFLLSCHHMTVLLHALCRQWLRAKVVLIPRVVPSHEHRHAMGFELRLTRLATGTRCQGVSSG